MRWAGVVIVLGVARVAALAGHSLTWSWWSPVAYLWQDAACALAFALVERGLRRTPLLAWSAYAAFVAYLAVSVPVTRVLSTPMTWTMWRAAGGALSDSIWRYVSVTNLLWVAGVAAVAVLVPAATRAHGDRHPPLAAMLAACAIVLAGPAGAARVDTRGLERNAWSALVVSALPSVPARASNGDWRVGRADRSPVPDLARWRGRAAGRHVVLVSLESTAAQYLGLYGATPDVMPNLSELARSSLVFDRAYAVYPESIKGLLSTLCSTYPPFDVPADRVADMPCDSIASLLAARGYRAALFHSGRFAYLGMDAVVRNRGYHLLADAGDIGGNHESSFGVDDASTVARMLSWIDSLPRGQRFFLTYLPISGHHPYEAPEPGPFVEHDDFGRYRNSLRYGDSALGALVRGLRVRGFEQDTVWIVLGDHGEAFGQHDGNFGHTFQLYEENVRVPFMIAAPGLIPNETRSPQAVSLIDVAPTLLDLLGIPAVDSHQGRSALDGDPRMALFFTDYSQRLLGLRDGRLKYVLDLDSGRSQLFDLERDPQELRNVATERRDDMLEYADTLRRWSAAQKARGY